MKERHKQWAKLSSVPLPPKQKVTIKFRLLPEVQQLENDIVLDIKTYRGLTWKSLNKISNLSKKLFGIDEADTRFKRSKNFDSWHEDSDKRQQALDSEARHESKFQTADLSDNDALPILMEMGYDFAYEDGRPLHLVGYMKRQVEAVAQRLAGHAPDLEEASVENFQSQLEEDARKFKARRR